MYIMTKFFKATNLCSYPRITKKKKKMTTFFMASYLYLYSRTTKLLMTTFFMAFYFCSRESHNIKTTFCMFTNLVDAFSLFALFFRVDVIQDSTFLSWYHHILISVLTLLGRAIHATTTVDNISH